MACPWIPFSERIGPLLRPDSGLQLREAVQGGVQAEETFEHAGQEVDPPAGIEAFVEFVGDLPATGEAETMLPPYPVIPGFAPDAGDPLDTLLSRILGAEVIEVEQLAKERQFPLKASIEEE